MIKARNIAHSVSAISLEFGQNVEDVHHHLTVEIQVDDVGSARFFFSEWASYPDMDDPSKREEVYDDDANYAVPVTDILESSCYLISRHYGLNLVMARQHLENLLNAHNTLHSINSRQGLHLGR